MIFKLFNNNFQVNYHRGNIFYLSTYNGLQPITSIVDDVFKEEDTDMTKMYNSLGICTSSLYKYFSNVAFFKNLKDASIFYNKVFEIYYSKLRISEELRYRFSKIDNEVIKDLLAEPALSFPVIDLIPDEDNPKMVKFYNKKGSIVSMKVGKFIKKILPHVEDKDLEEAVNLWTCYIDNSAFQEVSGEDIRFWYNEKNYQEEYIGTLEGSCMKYSYKSGYFNIYTENPDVVSMVILTEDSKLVGRALLWNTEKGFMMDRIYGSDVTIEKFKKYAKEKGYYYKDIQSHRAKKSWRSPKDDYKKSVEICIDINLNADWGKYPYLDTFSYTNCYDTISNVESRNLHSQLTSEGGSAL